MKEGIHPNYHTIKVTCSCGNSFETGSTLAGDALRTEVCDKCHPFYTGKQKIIGTAERVALWNRRYGSKNNTAADEAADNSSS